MVSMLISHCAFELLCIYRQTHSVSSPSPQNTCKHVYKDAGLRKMCLSTIISCFSHACVHSCICLQGSKEDHHVRRKGGKGGKAKRDHQSLLKPGEVVRK